MLDNTGYSCTQCMYQSLPPVTAVNFFPGASLLCPASSGFLAIQLFVSMDLQHFNMFEWLNFVNLVSHPKHELAYVPRH